jgi:hypothetical protein
MLVIAYASGGAGMRRWASEYSPTVKYVLSGTLKALLRNAVVAKSSLTSIAKEVIELSIRAIEFR